ncbi:MAG: dockerin type I domain-containing protein [Planctomycetota bacterium]
MSVETLDQRRVLAVITGQVFEDIDGSLRPESGEVQLSSRLAYIDANNNAAFDSGESFAVTDSSGQFQFDEIDPGIHSVRLYDGASGQRQTFPAEPVQSFVSQVPPNTADFGLIGDTLYVLAEDSLIEPSLIGSSSEGPSLPFRANSFAQSASGVALVNDSTGGVWLVRPQDQGAYRIGADQGLEVTAAAVGGDGQGVALAVEGGARRVMSFGVSDGGSVELSVTNAMVPADARVIGADSAPPLSIGSRSIFAWSEPSNSTRLSIWNNTSAQWVQKSATSVSGVDELLSFDDGAGLLAIRYDDGSVGVLDVDAGFAPLHEFDVDGPSKLIPGYDAIASINSIEAGFEFAVDDLRSGDRLVSRELDAAQIGTPRALTGHSFDSLFVLGDSAVAAIELDHAGARTVEVSDQMPVAEISFGVQVTSANYPPTPIPVLPVHGSEDTVLEITADTLDQYVSDAEGDRLIPVVVDPPSHGDVQFDTQGGIRYTPDANYFGDDLFAIVFYDGANVSRKMHFDISLSSVPDAPDGFEISGLQLPELAEPGYVIGSIEVEDVDSENNYLFTVSDARFEVVNSKLTYRGGAINFEGEPRIELTVSGYDQSAEHEFRQDLVISVIDENDPIAFFVIEHGQVSENAPGALVAELSVVDEDLPKQTISYSVDDQRFEVIGNLLRLKPSEALNFEVEPIVLMMITADDGAGSSLTVDFQVSVLDVINEGGDIGLSNKTVMEWEPGANVGQVTVNAAPANDFQLHVDDSRFEIDGTTLKLVDDVWVRYDEAPQIQVTITASSSEHGIFSKAFVIHVLQNETPFHNDDQPHDVDHDGSVSPGDALDIINYLNIYGPGPIGPGHPGYGYDVNGDGMVSTLDALLIINYLNRVSSAGAVDGEDNAGDSESDAGVSSDDSAGGLGTATDGEGEQIGSNSVSTNSTASGWIVQEDDDDDEGSKDPWGLYGSDGLAGS